VKESEATKTRPVSSEGDPAVVRVNAIREGAARIASRAFDWCWTIRTSYGTKGRRLFGFPYDFTVTVMASFLVAEFHMRVTNTNASISSRCPATWFFCRLSRTERLFRRLALELTQFAPVTPDAQKMPGLPCQPISPRLQGTINKSYARNPRGWRRMPADDVVRWQTSAANGM
jgi:hypothetical protein